MHGSVRIPTSGCCNGSGPNFFYASRSEKSQRYSLCNEFFPPRAGFFCLFFGSGGELRSSPGRSLPGGNGKQRTETALAACMRATIKKRQALLLWDFRPITEITTPGILQKFIRSRPARPSGRKALSLQPCFLEVP